MFFFSLTCECVMELGGILLDACSHHTQYPSFCNFCSFFTSFLVIHKKKVKDFGAISAQSSIFYITWQDFISFQEQCQSLLIVHEINPLKNRTNNQEYVNRQVPNQLTFVLRILKYLTDYWLNKLSVLSVSPLKRYTIFPMRKVLNF